jgi:hypothetical protein
MEALKRKSQSSKTDEPAMNGDARYEKQQPYKPVNMTASRSSNAMDLSNCVVQPELNHAVATTEENQIDDNENEDQKKQNLIARYLELQ